MKKKSIFHDESEDFVTGLLSGFNRGQSIRQQESAGQSRFVASETLPKECRNDVSQSEIYQKFGIEITGEADDLFNYVKLPDGWEKRATGHAKHSELIDEKNRVRALIFYKAAFYDRRADHSFCSRLSFTVASFDNPSDYSRDNALIAAYVMDNDRVLWKSEAYNQDQYYQAKDIATGWLNRNYPDWKNIFAYWDDEIPSVSRL